MLAVQRPPAHSFNAATRPGHCRNPSAPVVVRPTHTPGLLSLSKPAAPRQQQPQQQRQQRSSPRCKGQQRSPQPAPATAQAPSAAKADAPVENTKQTTTSAPTSDKSARGRQSAKDKAQRRSSSLSAPRGSARRLPHQPSPPPSDRIPSQAEVNTQQRHIKSNTAPNSNISSDPFVTTASNEVHGKDASLSKAGPKAPSYRSPPKLASHPTGKLARRRQQATTPSAPTKAVPVPRVKAADVKAAARSEPVLGANRPHASRASTGLPIADFEVFPICDDSSDLGDESDDTPPTTPIRETASVPPKKHAHWQGNNVFDNAPRTAPLSSTFAYPFVPSSPAGTPTPAQRRRAHRRVPSEGVFNMSMDEDSSSSETFDVSHRWPVALPKRRAQPASELHSVSGSPSTTGFYAGSMFQNSPSPDALPAPSF